MDILKHTSIVGLKSHKDLEEYRSYICSELFPDPVAVVMHKFDLCG